MTHFVVYDAANGAVKRHGSCSVAADLARQAAAGEAVLELAAGVPSAGVASVDLSKTPPAPVLKT